jgi:hypothetical protein
MAELFVEHPELERETLLKSRREALEAERAALNDALRQGLLSETVYEELREDLDRRLYAVSIILSEFEDDMTALGGE